MHRSARLTPQMMLQGYARGIFPMAESARSGELFWLDPRQRGVVPLEGFHVSRSLARAIRRGGHEIRIDTAFGEVVTACADRPETWINEELEELYAGLHGMGHAHSLEVWRAGALVGGVFGVTLGGAFFGESMFSRARDASKIALAYLVHRLWAGGFTLFDTQFLTEHLASLGAIEIPRAEYHRRLAEALARPADFLAPDTPQPGDLVGFFRPQPQEG